MTKLMYLIHPAEEGGYWAEVPALPGCVSQGETLDELAANMREATEAWILTQNEKARAKTRGRRAEPGVRVKQLAFA